MSYPDSALLAEALASLRVCAAILQREIAGSRRYRISGQSYVVRDVLDEADRVLGEGPPHPDTPSERGDVMTKPDPMELARQFTSLNADDFRMFWATVALEWDQEDGDVEAQWFYCGQKMRGTERAVIGALYSAVLSGEKAAREKKA